ncbi:MAG: PadR family transcriptional regulator [Candidatus Methanofastidiosia archaeon]|jgi:DNA-binding PadR family transcriptional regulator
MKEKKVKIAVKSCCDVGPPECCNMKGFLSFLVLWIISRENMQGCDVSRELEKRRGSKPSPGTVYPVLKELKEKGLIKTDDEKVYSITEKGEEELDSALTYFITIFYDVEEMIECCSVDFRQEERE